MNNKGILIAVFAVAVLVVGFLVFFAGNREDAVIRQENAVVSDESMVAEDNATTQMENTNSEFYRDYSEEEFATAQNEGRAVLFFHAGWCPTCRTLDKELQNADSSLPSDVTILKTDYDTENALKDKYTVVTQHTLVLVDDQGNEVDKVIGANLAGVLAWLEQNS